MINAFVPWSRIGFSILELSTKVKTRNLHSKKNRSICKPWPYFVMSWCANEWSLNFFNWSSRSVQFRANMAEILWDFKQDSLDFRWTKPGYSVKQMLFFCFNKMSSIVKKNSTRLRSLISVLFAQWQQPQHKQNTGAHRWTLFLFIVGNSLWLIKQSADDLPPAINEKNIHLRFVCF